LNVFQFTLVLPNETFSDALADKLFNAGCDDATLSQTNGEVLLDFDREDVSYEEAVRSALWDVKQEAGIECRLKK
jgi:hypothetical protein